MRPLIPLVLAFVLNLAAFPSQANTPEITLQQTRDWIVATLTNFAGYTGKDGDVVYKDISMEGCQLRFATVRTNREGLSELDTFAISVDSIRNVLWGTVSDPPRGYVLFTTAAPMHFTKERAGILVEHPTPVSTAATTVAGLEFGKPGTDFAEVASHMKTAILHAAGLCKVQLASN